MVNHMEQTVSTSKVTPEKLGESLDLGDTSIFVKDKSFSMQQETEVFSSKEQAKESKKISILMNFYGLANFIPLMAVLSNMDYFIYKYNEDIRNSYIT
ncbi:UNKNOWN [Stylonychia lemnae]|uniref:Uncharacterized protein n=1 Tax=Stylonychia lemnae TaxID=5949 RepID=A0A078AUK6_STYLE|nr:UNKNOWN [Stylonychia lemnae]|eukprot:CDW84563.1 UNKNOWN [Stylonychia lemnae]